MQVDRVINIVCISIRQCCVSFCSIVLCASIFCPIVFAEGTFTFDDTSYKDTFISYQPSKLNGVPTLQVDYFEKKLSKNEREELVKFGSGLPSVKSELPDSLHALYDIWNASLHITFSLEKHLCDSQQITNLFVTLPHHGEALARFKKTNPAYFHKLSKISFQSIKHGKSRRSAIKNLSCSADNEQPLQLSMNTLFPGNNLRKAPPMSISLTADGAFDVFRSVSNYVKPVITSSKSESTNRSKDTIMLSNAKTPYVKSQLVIPRDGHSQAALIFAYYKNTENIEKNLQFVTRSLDKKISLKNIGHFSADTVLTFHLHSLESVPSIEDIRAIEIKVATREKKAKYFTFSIHDTEILQKTIKNFTLDYTSGRYEIDLHGEYLGSKAIYKYIYTNTGTLDSTILNPHK